MSTTSDPISRRLFWNLSRSLEFESNRIWHFERLAQAHGRKDASVLSRGKFYSSQIHFPFSSFNPPIFFSSEENKSWEIILGLYAQFEIRLKIFSLQFCVRRWEIILFWKKVRAAGETGSSFNYESDFEDEWQDKDLQGRNFILKI